MADDIVSQAAFSSAPMGPPQTFSGPTGSMDPNWQRMLAAAKAGAISPQQLQQYAARMGYAQPTNQGNVTQAEVGGMQKALGQGQQPVTGPAGLGQVTGDMIGRAARALIDAGRKVTPEAPPQAQGDAMSGQYDKATPVPRAITDQYAGPMTSNTPSPLWNQ